MRVLLSIAAILVPIFAQAQPARIGVLAFEQAPEALKQGLSAGLREQGFVEGKNLLIEWRAAEGNVERVNQFAAELVRLKVQVIVANLTPAALAAKNATRSIAIVMAPAGDPMASGLVASLARPGGNITGVTNVLVDVGGKLVGLTREIQPNVQRIAVLLDTRTNLTKPFLDDVQGAATKSGIRIVPLSIKGESEIAEAFKLAQKERAQAMIVMPLAATKQVADLARQHRMLAISTGFASHTFPRADGLIGYGANTPELYRRAAVYVAKILRGANPADLPVEQAAVFDLVINLKTAKAIGVTVPKDMLVRANEVIE